MIPFEKMIRVRREEFQCLFITYKQEDLLFWYVGREGMMESADAEIVSIPQFAPVATDHREDDDQ